MSLLAKRFREVLLNGTWVANTNYKDQLYEMSWETAVTEMKSVNSIAVLAQHIHYYVQGLNMVFKGGNLEIKDKFSFDFPPITSQTEWETFLSKFWKDCEEFATLLEQLSDNKLNQVFVEEKYGSYQRNIEAMIEHSYYHLGQIVLLKKMIESSNNASNISND